MYKRLIILVLLFIAPLALYSQKLMDIRSVDIRTYELWQTKSWEKLISEGKEAISHGIDFYHLHVRMGIAYYELENFHKAIPHFEKAVAMSDEEAYLIEYLYYSCLFAERQADAIRVRHKYSGQLQERTGKNTFINNLAFWYGNSFIDDRAIADNFTINIDLQTNGTQVISKSQHVANLFLHHDISSHISLFHGYTFIDKTSFIYSQYDGNGTTTHNYNTKLHQYYLAGLVSLGKGLEFVPGFHYINLRYPMAVQRFWRGQIYWATETMSENDYVVFASLYKKIPYLTFGGSLNYAELNRAHQFQKDLHLGIYPLGNQNLYVVGTFSHQTETHQEDQENRMALNFKAGARIGNFLWIEPHLGTGEMRNFILNDGALVFNSLEMIKRRYGLRFITLISKNFQASVDYFIRENESSFIPARRQSDIINKINFKTHSITGGIKWNF